MSINLQDVLTQIGPEIAERAAKHDAEDTLVLENFALLKAHKVIGAQVPVELGGGGASHSQMCDFLRQLAHHCGSTALAISMNQHPIALNKWKYIHGKGGEPVLKKVAAHQAIIVSSGGRDFLESNGTMERVEGGYRVTAKKAFCSGAGAGDLFATSAVYDHPDDGPQVLHFGIPMTSEGLVIEDVWKVHGMRGTGSNDIVLNGVFVPDGAVSLVRPRFVFPPAWKVVLTSALPLFMGVYVGVAERAAQMAHERAQKRRLDPDMQSAIGLMDTELTIAQMAWRELVANANELDFMPSDELANAALIRKTLIARSAIKTTELAVQAVGGVGYFRGYGLERLLRDVRAGHYHPLPAAQQARFSGRLALGVNPITGI
ncbi:MAG: alkylation response protein AidB-like acyl-CoA dehydrogenase [Myxococcota bacterium]|jgi:alkylation response protein AidB-like acyl-CoA dehydrogenase